MARIERRELDALRQRLQIPGAALSSARLMFNRVCLEADCIIRFVDAPTVLRVGARTRADCQCRARRSFAGDGPTSGQARRTVCSNRRAECSIVNIAVSSSHARCDFV